MPRTYRFNKLVAVDIVEVPWSKDGAPAIMINFLNIVDHGTNLQAMIKVGDGFSKSSADT